VRIGTPLKDLIEECGGFVKEPAKVIFGGPMMGITQYTLDVPIIKGTSGIVFLSEEEAREGIKEEGVCIRCARCVDSCPMLLVPTALMNLVKLERFAEAEERGMGNCIECGACAYECPSKIPLVDYLKFGKSRMKR
jgi:electron transport complex protein RnfC